MISSSGQVLFNKSIAAGNLYKDHMKHVGRSNEFDGAFTGALAGAGVGNFAFVTEGQQNGLPETRYITDSDGYVTEATTTLNNGFGFYC